MDNDVKILVNLYDKKIRRCFRGNSYSWLAAIKLDDLLKDSRGLHGMLHYRCFGKKSQLRREMVLLGYRNVDEMIIAIIKTCHAISVQEQELLEAAI